MKLKIGTVSKKKKDNEEIQAKLNDYFNDLSDEDLEVMQIEADEDAEIAEEDNEITEEIDTTEADEEAEAKEAITELDILNKVGINTKYANRFTELYPKKRVIYRNLITKQFLEWYIKNVKIQLLGTITYVNSEHINQDQCEKIDKLLTKRLNEDIEIEDVKKESKTKKQKSGRELIDMETKEQADMYEVILHEKWEDREKGILELDLMIKEQLIKKGTTLDSVLMKLIKTFKLNGKLVSTQFEEINERVEKKEKKYIKAGELGIAIKYFHHIKFLYNLMSEKTDFIKSPTKKEIEHITTIKNLIEDRIELEPKKEAKKSNKVSFADYKDFIEG